MELKPKEGPPIKKDDFVSQIPLTTWHELAAEGVWFTCSEADPDGFSIEKAVILDFHANDQGK